MIRVAVCDDNEEYRQKIRQILLSYFEEKRIAGEVCLFSSGEAFLKLGEKMREFHLILLDVELGEGCDGIKTAQKIRIIDENLPIAFVSSHICYSTQGYLVNAYRYVLKNDLEILLYECMDSLGEKLKSQKQKNCFAFQEGNMEIDIGDFIYAESQGRFVNCYIKRGTKKEILHLQMKLDDLQKHLNHKDLIRIHKSFLVNAQYIREIKNYGVTLQSGDRLPIPKEKYRDVITQYQMYRRKW